LIATGNAPVRSLQDASVIVWDSQTGQRLHQWTGHAHVVRSVAFSGDSKQLAVVNGFGKVVVYELDSGKALRRLDTESAETVLFTEDNSSILVADSRNVRRWDLATGKELDALRGHSQRIYGLAVAENKTIATCAEDGTVRLWDQAGRELMRFIIPK